jgi:hypothetical protein
LKQIALDLGTAIRNLNALMDQPPPEAAAIFPTGQIYTSADARLPFSDKDLIALINGTEELKAQDQLQLAQVIRTFELPKVHADGFDTVDVEAIPDDTKVYIRSFLRERAATRR